MSELIPRAAPLEALSSARYIEDIPSIVAADSTSLLADVAGFQERIAMASLSHLSFLTAKMTWLTIGSNLHRKSLTIWHNTRFDPIPRAIHRWLCVGNEL